MKAWVKKHIIDSPRFIVASSGGGGNGGYGDKAEGSGWDLGLPGPNRGTYDQKIARMASDRMLRSRTSTLCTNVLLYYSLLESQCIGNSNFLLKFRKFQNKFSFLNFLTFTTHKITNQLTLTHAGLAYAGFWRSFFLEKWSLSFLHFLSNEDHCILYESWDVQLTFETLINAVGYKL